MIEWNLSTVYTKDALDLLKLPKGSASIWQFMPLAELLAILQSGELFFSSITKMTDRFDGRVPASVMNHYWELSGIPRKEYVTPRGSLSDQIVRCVRNGTFINCWHVNPVESVAMWSLYSTHHGIAVKSTVQKLIKAVKLSPAPINIGMVQYVDFSRQRSTERDLCFKEEFIKRKSFEHEKELRAVTMDTEVSKQRRAGVKVKVNVEELIEAVYVSPKLKAWVKGVIARELEMHHLPTVPVMQSKLSSSDLK